MNGKLLSVLDNKDMIKNRKSKREQSINGKKCVTTRSARALWMRD